VKPLAIAWVLLVTATAVAQPAPPDPQTRAKELYNQGTKHFNLREYPEAVVAFKEAYRLYSEPLFLFNIAQAYRLSGDCLDAHGFYKTYLRVSPTAPDRAKVEKFIAELEPCATAAAASTATDKSVTDANVTDTPIIDKPVADTPAIDKPVADKPVDNVPPGPAVVPPRPLPSGNRNIKIAGLATIGGGVLLLIGGGAFSFRAARTESDIEATCAGGCDGAEIDSLDRRGRSAQRTATTLYIAGGVITAAGGALVAYAILTDRAEAITVTPTEGGAMATARFRF